MKRVGRYALYDVIGKGGMGTVHLGQVLGDGGFARIVAIKRLREDLVHDAASIARFRDEAHLSARVRHPHVVATYDVLEDAGELLLVMEYVHGVTLDGLVGLAERGGVPFPQDVAIAIVLDLLGGLSAVHAATDELGSPLHIVHRDVSPTNVIVGADGNARLLDFGVAKAAVRSATTKTGAVVGKLGYMAPEQLRNEALGPATDGYAASVVLWELLTGKPLFDATDEGTLIGRVLEGVILPPSKYASAIAPALDEVVLRGLARAPKDRFASCADMAAALHAIARAAAPEHVGRWVQDMAGDVLARRAAAVAAIEGGAPIAPADPEPPTRVRTRTTPEGTGARPRWTRRALVAGVAACAVVAGARLASQATASPPPAGAAEPHPAAADIAPAPLESAAPVLQRAPQPPPATRARGPRRVVAPRTDRCDPMFTVDANGIRRVKPECL